MKLIHLLAGALGGTCGLAHADATSWDPSWNLSGFGTLGYTETDTNTGLYAGPGQAGGASKEGTLGVDSKFGAQVSAKANNVLSATVQAISQRNGRGNFKPAVEWAFMKAQVAPGLSLRAGRIGAPLFAVSDFRSIGYSNLWVRTPLDVYDQVAFSHFDGGDAIYQGTLGPATVTGQVYYGHTNAVGDGTPIHVQREAGVNLTVELDNGLSFRAGHVQGKLTADSASLTQLVGILAQTPYAAGGQEASVDNKDASFTGFGVAYDQGNWVANLEYTKRKTSSYLSSTTGWAATLGYRVGKFTPYAIVSQLKVDSSNVNNNIPTSDPQLAPLAAAVSGLLASQNLAEKTDAIGLRWDAWKNVDVKVQYDRIEPASGAHGVFNRVTSPLPSTVNVYSVAVDFVF
jgi:hypothetical protein